MGKTAFFTAIILFYFALSPRLCNGQQSKSITRTSPIGLENYKDGDMYIKLTYGSPSKGKRSLFGATIPFYKLWRFGDDEATELTVTRPVRIEGKTLPAGTYSLFAIPKPDKWIIIINTELGQYGHFKYDSLKDIHRFEAPVYKSPRDFDRLTFYIEPDIRGADIVMVWEATAIRIPIEYK